MHLSHKKGNKKGLIFGLLALSLFDNSEIPVVQYSPRNQYFECKRHLNLISVHPIWNRSEVGLT